MPPKDNTLADKMARFKKGEIFDWCGAEISGSALSEAIREACEASARIGIPTLKNARIKGHIILDTIGWDGSRPSFQAIDCQFSGGFRSGHSNWGQLSFLRSEIAFIQLPYARFDRDLSICETKCRGPCLLVGLEVAGGITLVKSKFTCSGKGYSLNLSEANVGRNVDARGIEAEGLFLGCQISVSKDVNLDGSKLAKSEGTDPRALDFSEAKIAECELVRYRRRFHVSF